MNTQALLSLSLMFVASATFADFREIDGSNNNRIDPSMGMSHTPLLRHVPHAYGDGVSSMGGASRPSARVVSNALATVTLPPEPATGPSDYLWAWGQFLDHDIGISPGATPEEHEPIPVPTADPWFDPFASGTVVIPFKRTLHDLSSGTGTDNPREQINEITAWIDGSGVYGSNETRANALRTLDGTGRLKTSAGRMLPFNVDGLPNEGGHGSDLFLAGDVRANEQLGLTALHTLFVREHNRLVRVLARRNPNLSGDRLYERARRVVGAQIQDITYNEFLPTLLGRNALSRYTNYKPWVDASIRNEFSTAFFRFGHSAVGTRLLRLNRNLRETRHGHLELVDAFFRPTLLVTEGGIAPVLRGMAKQACKPIDVAVNHTLRNFLFGPPGAGGLDLVALNIQRGRDHGLADYNAARVAYGLPAIAEFSDITSNPSMQESLESLYGTVDNIDLWVGTLAEDTHDGMVGKLAHTAIVEQFEALRDGDRYWHERTLGRWGRSQLARLSTIIKRNTAVGNEIQRNVFMLRNALDS